MTKRDLRQTMRRMLTALPIAEMQARSAAAATLLFTQPEFINARVAMIFLSMPHEIDTTAVVQRLFEEGRTVAAPYINPETDLITPVRLQRAGEDAYRVGHLGVREPIGDETITLDAIDFVLVPGMAFDERGGRLGRGRAHFDRFLCSPGLRAVRCGYAFEWQLVDQAPQEPHDQVMDMLITDGCVRRCGARSPVV